MINFKDKYVEYVALAVKEAEKIPQTIDMSVAEKIKAYAAVAQMIFNGRSLLFEEPTPEIIKEDIAENKPKKKSSKKKAVKEEPVEETAQETPAKDSGKKEEILKQISEIVDGWLTVELNNETSQYTPTLDMIKHWLKQVDDKAEDISDLSEENAKRFLTYLDQWKFVVDTWYLADISQIMESVTQGQRTTFEEVTPDNIGMLVAYTEQQRAEQEEPF